MYLHEFQAKEILKLKKILVPESKLVINKEDIDKIIADFKSEKIVLKAQIHAGGRGKHGGIRIIEKKKEEIIKNLTEMLNSNLVTNQTDKNGKKIKYILIEEFIKINKEMYISMYIDRTIESIVLLVSNFGGMNIEDQNEENLIKFKIDINYGICDYHIRNIIYFLKIEINFFDKIKSLIEKLFEIFIENDLTLLEINPLIEYKNNFYCIDAKFEVDDNSNYRNNKLFDEYDYTQNNDIEIEAKKKNLNYISLDGNIGCIVNGAGLAMATMDLLKINGLNPLNFLDIGGTANEETLINSIKIITLDKNLKIIFINIFGGIIRCDIICETLIKIIKENNIKIPIIIRLAGNMAEDGINKIKKSNLNIIAETDIKKTINIIKNIIEI